MDSVQVWADVCDSPQEHSLSYQLLSYVDDQNVLYHYTISKVANILTELREKKILSNLLVFDISSCYLNTYTASVKLLLSTKFFLAASFSMCNY